LPKVRRHEDQEVKVLSKLCEVPTGSDRVLTVLLYAFAIAVGVMIAAWTAVILKLLDVI